ncbi:hypothetical protein M433DRAFT_402155 [Acidomyces richmondensis BFW]|nr:MAG: hypothetical protein FE78DRAFT_205677 [Acidomyces sp. 'richmondensis']KYG48636.1 hypothetical protein M433DRAFT_402155 [Acidomyces richmondensis BFW]
MSWMGRSLAPRSPKLRQSGCCGCSWPDHSPRACMKGKASLYCCAAVGQLLGTHGRMYCGGHGIVAYQYSAYNIFGSSCSLPCRPNASFDEAHPREPAPGRQLIKLSTTAAVYTGAHHPITLSPDSHKRGGIVITRINTVCIHRRLHTPAFRA